MEDDQKKETTVKKNKSEIQNETSTAEAEKLKQERDEYLDGWKRAKADLINYKKEETQRLEQFAKFSNEALVAEMLNVLDSFDLGLATLPESDPGRRGIEMIKAQCLEILKRYGLEVVQTAVGKMFDPAQEEAVGEVESAAPPGTVAEVVGRGYALHGRIVRPARVKISKQQSK
ncbi:MAG: nucleotide exchange factor GrpE [Patescibacteria group bacterium]